MQPKEWPLGGSSPFHQALIGPVVRPGSQFHGQVTQAIIHLKVAECSHGLIRSQQLCGCRCPLCIPVFVEKLRQVSWFNDQ